MRVLRALPHALFVGAAVAVVSWLGVPLRDTLAYAAFFAFFTLLPGLAVYFLLWPRTTLNIRAFAIGWPLGFVMEVGAYQLALQMGLRSSFALYPLITFAILGFLYWRKKNAGPDPSNQEPVRWRLSALLAIASFALLAYFSLNYFLATPLPGTTSGVTYFVDYPYQISIAAEILRHWPVTDPHIAGERLEYYLNQFVDMAAAAQITGVSLPVIFFRLYLLPVMALLPAQYFALGKAASGKNSIALLTVALGLFFGEADTNVIEPTLFGNWGLGYLHISSSYTLGLILSLAIFILLVELATHTSAKTNSSGANTSRLIALAILLMGLGGTKASALPVFAGGLTLYLAVQFVLRKPLDKLILGAWALAVAILLYFYLMVYAGMDRATSLAPLTSILRMDAVTGWGKFIPAQVLPFVALIPALIGFAPAHFAGITWLVTRKGQLLPNALLFSLFATGLGAFLALNYENYGQILFMYYAMPAACVLAAFGLMDLWQAMRRAKPITRAALAVPVCLCVGLAALDAPFDARLNFTKWRTGQPIYTQSTQLTPGMNDAYTWLRQNTNPNDVLATNNPLIDKTIYIIPTPHNFYLSAFAERRVFLEGWAYSTEAHRLGYKNVEQMRAQPYPERKALNDRVFYQADAPSLKTMREQFGVRYLFVDKLNAPPAPDLSAISQKVFENNNAVIYKVAAP